MACQAVLPPTTTPARSPDVDAFLKSVSTACKDGQRPDSGIANSPAPRTGGVQRLICSPTRRNLSTAWLPIAEPAASAEELMDQLATMLPEAHVGNVQLRTWKRRVKAWRAGRAKEMILGRLRKPTDMAADV